MAFLRKCLQELRVKRGEWTSADASLTEWTDGHDGNCFSRPSLPDAPGAGVLLGASPERSRQAVARAPAEC